MIGNQAQPDRPTPHAARIAAYRAAHPRGGPRPGLGRPATGRTPSRSVSARVSIEVAARFEAHCEERGTTVGARLGEMIRAEIAAPQAHDEPPGTDA